MNHKQLETVVLIGMVEKKSPDSEWQLLQRQQDPVISETWKVQLVQINVQLASGGQTAVAAMANDVDIIPRRVGRVVK
jgi:hypothetical protein